MQLSSWEALEQTLRNDLWHLPATLGVALAGHFGSLPAIQINCETPTLPVGSAKVTSQIGRLRGFGFENNYTTILESEKKERERFHRTLGDLIVQKQSVKMDDKQRLEHEMSRRENYEKLRNLSYLMTRMSPLNSPTFICLHICSLW